MLSSHDSWAELGIRLSGDGQGAWFIPVIDVLAHRAPVLVLAHALH